MTQNVKVAGEAAVSSLVQEINKKLTKVSSMPESPALNTIVLYVGTTTGSYVQGGIYQYDGTSWNQINQSGGDTTNCYETTDTAETALDDADYIPFYDSSATAKRKSLWSNIKSTLKTYFDTIYSTITTSKTASSEGTDLSLVTTGEKYIWNNKQNALTFDTTPTSGSSNPVTSDGIYDFMSDIINDFETILSSI